MDGVGIGIEIGHVAALFRYPVKSMRGEALDELKIGRDGPAGDRRYAFARNDGPSDFPYLTGRQIPDLLGYVPSFSVPEDPRRSAVRVRTPEGDDLAIESEELRARLERAYGSSIQLLPADDRSYPDAAPVSLISTATVAALGTLAGVGASLDPRRFRPNILVAPAQPGPSPEDDWIGRTVQLGAGESAPRVRIEEKDVRCKMVNIEPDSRDTRLDLLAAMVQARRQTAGVYARVERTGIVMVGVPIFLLAEKDT